MSRLLARTVATAGAVAALAGAAHATPPTTFSEVVDQTAFAPATSAACGFPVFITQRGTVYVTLFHDKDGAIVREADWEAGFEFVFTAPTQGTSFRYPFTQRLTRKRSDVVEEREQENGREPRQHDKPGHEDYRRKQPPEFWGRTQQPGDEHTRNHEHDQGDYRCLEVILEPASRRFCREAIPPLENHSVIEGERQVDEFGQCRDHDDVHHDKRYKARSNAGRNV